VPVEVYCRIDHIQLLELTKLSDKWVSFVLRRMCDFCCRIFLTLFFLFYVFTNDTAAGVEAELPEKTPASVTAEL